MVREGTESPAICAALERHDLPAGHGGVAAFTRLVAPTSRLGMLCLDDEIDRPLGAAAHLLVVGQRVQLGQGDRGQSVAVHYLVAAGRQVSVDLLMPQQPIGGHVDVLPIVGGLVVQADALEMRLAGGQKRQHSQRRGGPVGLDAALSGAGDRLAAQCKCVQAPTAVGVLMMCNPAQCSGDGNVAGFCGPGDARGSSTARAAPAIVIDSRYAVAPGPGPVPKTFAPDRSRGISAIKLNDSFPSVQPVSGPPSPGPVAAVWLSSSVVPGGSRVLVRSGCKSAGGGSSGVAWMLTMGSSSRVSIGSAVSVTRSVRAAGAGNGAQYEQRR